jgi:hypothetical protein
MNVDKQTAQRALGRLISIASRDTGQSRRLANFLLAWHNAEENGGWDPVDLWLFQVAPEQAPLCGVFDPF